MNFLGLGFSFGAKDSGLEDKQNAILSNFESMSTRMLELGKAADKANMGDIVSPGQTEQLDKLGEGLEKASVQAGHWQNQSRNAKGQFEAMGAGVQEATDTLGNFEEQSRNAKGQFQGDARQMEADTRKVGGGFNFIRDAMEKLGSLVSHSKLQTFIQSLSLVQLGGIASAIGDIGSEGTNLTTGYEAELHSLSKSARATGANFGYTGKELKKFTSKATSMAKGLAIDANTAATSLRAWDEAGSELAAMGFKNAKQVAKFSEVYGVNADVLRNSGLRMRKEFGMGDKEISQVTGAFAKMGQITGDVTGAMGEMPKMMDLLRRRAASMGKSLDSKQLASYAASSAGLAAGFMQMGQSSAQAREHAMSLTEEMIKSKEGFQDMFGGVGADLSDFNKDIAIAFGDVGVSFESMSKGPEEFISGMAEMVQKAKKNGDLTTQQTNVMSAHLRKAFGDDRAAELMLFFDKADQATLDLMKTVKNTPAELGKMADEGHKSAKTLAVRFEEMEDSMVTSFRSIGKASAESFVDDAAVQYEAFGKSMKKVAGNGGVMGKFVTKLSEIHQLGAKALLPKFMRPWAALIGKVAKELIPMVGGIIALGVALKAAMTPMAAVMLGVVAVGALVYWFIKLKKSGMSTAAALGHMGGKFMDLAEIVGEKVLEAFKRLAAWFKSVDWGKIGKSILSGIAGGIEKSNKLLLKIPWKKIWTGTFQAIGKVWDFLTGKEFQNWIVRFSSAIGSRVAMLGAAILWMFEQAVGYIAKIKIGPIVQDLLNIITTAVLALGAALGPIIQEIANKLPGLLVQASNAIIDIVLQIPAAVERIFLAIGAGIQTHGPAIMAQFWDFVGEMLNGMLVVAERILMELPGLLLKVGDALVVVVDVVINAVLMVFKSLEDYLVKKFPDSAATIHKVFSVIGGIVYAIGETLKFIFQAVATALSLAFKIAGPVVGAIFWVIWEVAKGVFDLIADTWGMFVLLFSTIWTAVEGVTLAAWWIIQNAIVDPIMYIYEKWGAIKDWFSNMFDLVVGAVETVWKPISKILMAPIDLAKGAWNLVTGIFTDPIGAIKEAWGGLVGWFGDLFDDLVDIPKKAWNNVKSFGNDTKDLFTGDLVPALMSKSERQIDTLTNALKMRGQSEAQIAEAVKAAQASGDLKGLDIGENNNPFYMKLRKNNFDVQAAIADDTDFFAMQRWRSAEQLANKMEWEAQRAAESEKAAMFDVTKTLGDESATQLGIMMDTVDDIGSGVLAEADSIVAGVEEKTSKLFGLFDIDTNAVKSKIASAFTAINAKMEEEKKNGIIDISAEPEKDTPTTSLVLNARGVKNIGEVAEKSLGRAGAAVDGFSKTMDNTFHKDKKRNISVIADEAFSRIEKRALEFKDIMRDIWSDILAMTIVAMNALQMDAMTVAGKLNAIARASETVSKQADDTPVVTKTFKAGESKDEAMLNATHWPDWYTQDFKKIATAMRDSMQAQSVAGGGGPSASAGARITLKSTKATNSAASRNGTAGPTAGGTVR